MNARKSIIPLLTATLLVSGLSQAAVVISNPSFESPDSNSFQNLVTQNFGQITTGSAGQGTGYDVGAPDGDQYGQVYSSGGGFSDLSQWISSDAGTYTAVQIAADTTYTFSLQQATPDVESRQGRLILGYQMADPGSFTAAVPGDFWNPAGASQLAKQTFNTSATANVYESASVSYTSPSSGGPVGGYLFVVFGLETDTGGQAINFDSLNITAIPEPSTLSLLGIASLAGIFLTRKRNRTTAK